MKLTQKQSTFCLHYFKTGNATESVILAKFAPRSAAVTGSRLLRKANIQERLKELQVKAEDAAVMSVVERKRKLSIIGRAELIDFMQDDEPVLSKNTPNHAAAEEYSVSTRYAKNGDPIVTRSVKLLNPVSAIQELNKMEKIYSESGTTNNFIDNRKIILVSDLTDEQLTNIITLESGSGTRVIESPVSPPETC